MEQALKRSYYPSIKFAPVKIKSDRRSKQQLESKELYEALRVVLHRKKKSKKHKSKRKRRSTIKKVRSLRKKRNRWGAKRMNSLFNELHLLDE